MTILNKIIKFRKYIHKNAEGSLKEFNTQKSIIDFLKNILNIKEKNIKVCGNTGLIIKLKGKGEKINNPKNIMIRAEMDALEMNEKNDLEYKSNTNFFHACGHDGHMAILIYSIYLYLNNINKIPKNCSVNFLFQPGEEGKLGSVIQIKENCLNGIDEIFGLHNYNFEKEGDIYLKEGYMFAASFTHTVQFIGKGGYYTIKNKLNNPILGICEFNLRIEKYLKKFNNSREIILSFPQLETSKFDNIIPESAFISGFSRGYDLKLWENIKNKIFKIAKEVALKYNLEFKINTNPVSEFPVDNDKNLTNKIIKILENKFGKIKNNNIPVLASEDFSYFQNKIPGVFIILSNGFKENLLHSENYIFNDNIIKKGGEMWLEIIINRLNNYLD